MKTRTNETGKATHTPGPWEMRGPCEITGRYSVTHNGPLFYVGDAGEPGDGEANARLAASAPELLEALRDAEFLLRKAGQLAGPMRDSFNRSAADARAAIAKATGGGQ
jgi:hypothetical protein